MQINTKQEHADALAKARDLAQDAGNEGRDLTADETKTIDDIVAAAEDYRRRTTVEAKAAELGLGTSTGEVERFDLSVRAAAAFARRAVIAGGGIGTKAPLDGTVLANLPTTRETTVETLPAAARAFLSLFETRKRTTRTWSYLTQTTREDAAALVKPGDTKPMSRYGLTTKTGELQAIAHLSEPVDKFDLRDTLELEGFLAGEMVRGVFDAIEDAVLNGVEDGDGAAITGLLNATGVHQVEAGADAVTTIRTALAQIETAGYLPGGVVLTPNTWAAIEAHRNDSGRFDANGPINSTDRKVWGVPVFTTTNVADGQAIAVDKSAAIVSVDQRGVEVEWDSAGERFTRNEYICRAETRIAVEVRKPAGIAVATLPTA